MNEQTESTVESAEPVVRDWWDWAFIFCLAAFICTVVAAGVQSQHKRHKLPSKDTWELPFDRVVADAEVPSNAPPCYCILRDEAGQYFIKKQITEHYWSVMKLEWDVSKTERDALIKAWNYRIKDVIESTNAPPATEDHYIRNPVGQLTEVSCEQ